jgi:hypothetical protein
MTSPTYRVIIPPDDPLPPPPNRSAISPTHIAEFLRLSILGNPALQGVYSVDVYGSTLHITKNVGTMSVHVADTLEGTGLSLIKGAVAGADELPPQAPEGFKLRITGDPSTTVDDYWMEFVAGRWQECVEPGMKTQVNTMLMPWVLQSSGSGGGRSFSFGPTEWEDRKAGNDKSNPIPALPTIDTLFSTEGRLGFTSGASVVLTASGEPRRIWRKTVAQLLPNDPVAVRSTLAHVGRYHAVVQWDGASHMWSELAQRALYGDPAITPTTVAIDPASSFVSDPGCAPVVVGTRIYYARQIDGSVRVYEYWRPPGYDSLPEVKDLTEQVPSYIVGRARTLAADEALGFLAVVLREPSSSLYVANLRQGQSGQSVAAWHRWSFAGATVVDAKFVRGRLALLLNRNGSLAVETLDVDTPATTALGPVADAGGPAVVPALALSRLYLQAEGTPDATTRVTLRNITIQHRDTRAATLTLSGEQTPRLTISQLQPDAPIRVPVLRTLGDVGLTASWTGFLSNIELQGSYVSRSRRV